MQTSKRKIVTGLAILLGLACIGIALIALWDWYKTTHHVNLPSPTAVRTHSTDKPNEAPIDTRTTTYMVPADQPRLIEIPSINIQGYIQRVGLDQNNAIATPGNIHMAGWYTDSAKPGEQGVSILDGHVHGRFEPGIFENIHKLKAGDAITVEYGDGTRHNFSVVKVSTYAANEAAAHMFDKLPSTDKELVLITCGGKYNKVDSSYDQRVLVYAKNV